MQGFTKAVTDAPQHWPSFIGFAGIDWLSATIYPLIPRTGGPMDSLLVGLYKGAISLVRFQYFENVKAIPPA